MDHDDHVTLIRAGVEGAGVEGAGVEGAGVEGVGPRWLELGAGTGEFTLALADILGGTGSIVALDRDRRALEENASRVAARFPATSVESVVADFTARLPPGPFDGVLAANSIHFVAEPGPLLDAIGAILAPAGRLVLVEYDADRGNPWVPHPISFRRWSGLAPAHGFGVPVRIHRVPSRFLGAIYGAVASRP